MQIDTRLCHIQKICSGGFITRRVSGAVTRHHNNPWRRAFAETRQIESAKKCDTKTPV